MSEREEIQGSVGREFPASEMQATLGAIARGQRFVDALEGDDPDNVITWGEAKYAILQLIGDLQHEQAEHEKTRDLLKLVERGSDRLPAEEGEGRRHPLRLSRPSADRGREALCQRKLAIQAMGGPAV